MQFSECFLKPKLNLLESFRKLKIAKIQIFGTELSRKFGTKNSNFQNLRFLMFFNTENTVGKSSKKTFIEGKEK